MVWKSGRRMPRRKMNWLYHAISNRSNKAPHLYKAVRNALYVFVETMPKEVSQELDESQ